MEQVDFTLYTEPSTYFSGNILILMLMGCLPVVAWALFAAHFRRSDRGAWAGTGLYLAALMPTIIGLGWTLFTFNRTITAVRRAGSESVGPLAYGAAEALFTTAFGFWSSALIVASMYFWLRRLPGPTVGESTLPGTWLLGSVLGGVLLAQGGALVIAIRLVRKVIGLDAPHGLILVLALGVAALAIVAIAAIRHAPRGPGMPRRAHAVVAGTLVVLLAAAGMLTWVAVEYFTEVARHG